METRAIRALRRVLEALFLALTVIYLLYLAAGTTTFYLPFPAWFDRALLRSMACVAALRWLLTGPRRWEPWLSAAMAAVYYMVFRATGYRFLVYLGVLTVGLAGIDYRRILRDYLLAIGAFSCATVVAALTGAITNFVYTTSGGALRSSWGFCYPTDFASIVLYALLALWVVWRKLPDWAMLAPCLAFILLAKYIARSDTSYICGLLFAGLIFYHALERRVIARRAGLRWISRGSDILLIIAFPLCASVMFLLMAAYRRGMGVGVRLDGLMSSRLSLAVDAWRLHGLRAFGTPFEQNGSGFSTFANANYNFIDSSYPLILLRYGWALLLALGALWGWTVYRAIKCGDRRLALVMGLIAVHSFSEHHFIEANYNLLLVMPFAAYAAHPVKAEAGSRTRRNRALYALAVTLAIGAALYLSLPRLLSWLKTVLQSMGLCGGGANGWRVLWMLTGGLALFAAACWSLYRIVG
ncbi:MAG: hypothetical protein IJ769_03750, partial [Clostridia bacterium]|nr:hypothetical protein [Clostridia bacterium]